MANELEVMQTKGNLALASSLNNASAIITKDYLDRLENYKIMSPSEEDLDIDIAECGTFYKLSRLVINREENFLNKLTTIVNVASSMDCSIATVISSDGYNIDYYFGILSKKDRNQKGTGVKRRMADAAAFKGALQGNLAGSKLEELSKADVNEFRKRTLAKEGSCYSSISGIVALRDADDKSMEGYVQGMENLVDSLKGQRYTIVMLADPVSTSEIRVIRQGYEMLHTQLSTFARSAVTLHESDTLSLSKSKTQGISQGIAQGIAMTQSRTTSKGTSSGVNAGGQFGLDFGIKAVVSAGISMGSSSGTADTLGRTHTTTETRQRSSAVTDTASSAKTAGKSLQLTYENRSVKALLDKIDKHLERLDRCESFGAFDCAAYVVADQRETALAVAGNYNALMRGRNSSVQASHINSWFRPEDTAVLGKYIGSLVHPRFIQNNEEKIIVTPASMISGEELAIQIGLPKNPFPELP